MAKISLLLVVLTTLLAVGSVPRLVSAETITLKSGKTVQGAICKVDENFYYIATLKKDGLVKVKKESVAQVSPGTESELQPVCPEKLDRESSQTPQNLIIQQQQQQQQTQEAPLPLPKDGYFTVEKGKSKAAAFTLEFLLPPTGYMYAAWDEDLGTFLLATVGMGGLDLGFSAWLISKAADPGEYGSKTFALGALGGWRVLNGVLAAVDTEAPGSSYEVHPRISYLLMPAIGRDGFGLTIRFPFD